MAQMIGCRWFVHPNSDQCLSSRLFPSWWLQEIPPPSCRRNLTMQKSRCIEMGWLENNPTLESCCPCWSVCLGDELEWRNAECRMISVTQSEGVPIWHWWEFYQISICQLRWAYIDTSCGVTIPILRIYTLSQLESEKIYTLGIYDILRSEPTFTGQCSNTRLSKKQILYIN